ncbi:hypothetical protein C8J56DRAFT_973167 [Mycena floridula]|nr:hypothetical protein C8J56DRAFT_973167 [Mycena floridula]
MQFTFFKLAVATMMAVAVAAAPTEAVKERGPGPEVIIRTCTGAGLTGDCDIHSTANECLNFSPSALSAAASFVDCKLFSGSDCIGVEQDIESGQTIDLTPAASSVFCSVA